MNSAVTLLERAIKEFPDNIAIEETDKSITYREYRQLARKVGTAILSSKYKYRPVVVLLDKNIKSLTSFMGARYASSPYVPLDINMPLNRLQKIVDSLKPCVLLTDKKILETLADFSFTDVDLKLYDELVDVEEDEELMKNEMEKTIDEDIAYIIYTSGSTGIPKGAIRPDKGIKDWLNFVSQKYNYNSNTIMASITPFYYEMSNLDVYYSIYCGARLVIVPNILLMLAPQLMEFLKEKNVNSIFSVPSVLINIANSGTLEKISVPSLKNVMFSGEVMPNKQLNIWRKYMPSVTYTNIYGTSETSFICFYNIERKFEDDEPLPTGKCSDYLKMFLLKDDGTEAINDEEGELCLTGSTMFHRYWNDEARSKLSFVSNPLKKDEIVYKTGDNAYINEYGELCFRTRKDFQIKKRGHRIELGEIEHAAMKIKGIINAAAIYEAEKEDIILFLETNERVSLHPFNRKLLDYIPKFMLPSRIIPLKKLFYKANGKMDRVRLRTILNNKEKCLHDR